MGELVMVFILALIVALLYNWGSPRFYATSFGTRLQGSFVGTTFATAIVIFLAIWAASLALSATTGREPIR